MKCLSFLLLVALPCLAYSGPTILGGTENCPDDFTLDRPAVQLVLDTLYGKYGEGGIRSVDIVNCTQQNVAGPRYRFTLKLNGEGEHYLLCDADVWVPISKPPQLEDEVKCKGYPEIATGGPMEISMDSELAKIALKYALTSINLRSNSLNYMTYAGCTSLTSQVVAGIEIRFKDLTLAMSTCTKDEGFSSQLLEDCPVDKNSKLEWKNDVTVFIPAVHPENAQVTIGEEKTPHTVAGDLGIGRFAPGPVVRLDHSNEDNAGLIP